ncbi:hypothetical protein WJX72_005888 [[Myrmecia] bisecta]|uniref:BRCT domain-containing protein n=1 Tax=[Myrmecia] bisecta TaxID=41462 RepID=A0AAW1Q0G2_9CHLO
MVGTERSLADIDAAMRAHGFRFSPTLPATDALDPDLQQETPDSRNSDPDLQMAADAADDSVKPRAGMGAAAAGSNGGDPSSQQTAADAAEGAVAQVQAGTGAELVGRRIRVYWPDDNRHYPGRVIRFNAATGKHFIQYDDGDTEDLDLQRERWHFRSSDAGASPSDSRDGSSEFDGNADGPDSDPADDDCNAEEGDSDQADEPNADVDGETAPAPCAEGSPAVRRSYDAALPADPDPRADVTAGGDASESQAECGLAVKRCQIACSGIDRPLLEQLKRFCRQMGNSQAVSAINSATTHAIVKLDGELLMNPRTLKYFQAVLRGCWVVSWAWVATSMQAGRWVDEAPFECRGDPEYLGAPARGRLRRIAGGPPIFHKLRVCLVEPWDNRTLPKSALAELIQLGGGEVVDQVPNPAQKRRRRAKAAAACDAVEVVAVTIINTDEPEDESGLAEARENAGPAPLLIMNWVLDSIRNYGILNIAKHAV